MTAEEFVDVLHSEIARLEGEISVLRVMRDLVMGLRDFYLHDAPRPGMTLGDTEASPLASAGDMGIAISEPEICETGENYSDPIPWPVAATPETGIPVSDGGDLAPEELGSALEQADEIAEEPAPEGAVIAPKELAHEPAAPSNVRNPDIAPRDTQGGEEPATPAAAPAPAEQSGDRAGGEAPPAANIEPDDWAPLIERVLAGETAKVVATEVGVKPMVLHGKATAAKRAAAKKGADSAGGELGPDLPDDATEAAVSEPDPQPVVPIQPAANSARIVVPEARPVAVERRPQDFSDGGGWTAQEDLTVLRLYGQGRNAYAISQQLKGRSAADVVTRFRKLVPNPGSANQARALKAAEERVAAERRAAE